MNKVLKWLLNKWLGPTYPTYVRKPPDPIRDQWISDCRLAEELGLPNPPLPDHMATWAGKTNGAPRPTEIFYTGRTGDDR